MSAPFPDAASIYYIANQNMGMHLNPLPEASIAEVLTNAETHPQNLNFRAVTLNRPKPGTCFLAVVPPNPEDGYYWQDQEQIKKIKLPNGRELEIISRDQGYVFPGNTHCTVSKRLYKLISLTNANKVFFVHYLHPEPNVRNIPVNMAIAQSITNNIVKRKKMSAAAAPMDMKSRTSLTPQQQMQMHQQMIAQQQAQFQMQQQAQMQQQQAQQNPDNNNEKLTGGDEMDYLTTKEIALTRFKRNHAFMHEIMSIMTVADIKKEAAKSLFPEELETEKLKETVEQVEKDIKKLQEEHSLNIKSWKEANRSTYADIAAIETLKSKESCDQALKDFAAKHKLKIVPSYKAMKVKISNSPMTH